MKLRNRMYTMGTKRVNIINFSIILVLFFFVIKGHAQVENFKLTLTGSWGTGDYRNLVVKDKYAYCAMGSGLDIIDLHDMTYPRKEKTFYMEGEIDRVAIRGNYAYVTVLNWGMKIVDITNPTQPVLKGEFRIRTIRHLEVSGRYAYLACGGSGLVVVDVSVPTNPVKMGIFVVEKESPATLYPTTLNPIYSADRVSVWGNYTCVKVTYWKNEEQKWYYYLYMIDISNPGAPVLRNYYPCGEQDLVSNPTDVITDFYYGKNKLFMTTSGSGLWVLEVGNPEKPRILISKIDAYSSIKGMFISGDYMVVPFQKIIEVYDISNEAAPKPMGVWGCGRKINIIGVYGTYVFIKEENGKLDIIDISSPATPRLIGTIDNSAGYTPRLISVSGKYAYTWNGWGLSIVDVTDPLRPILAGKYKDESVSTRYGKEFLVSGDYAYERVSQSIKIIDMSTKTYPVLASNYKSGFELGIYMISVKGNYLYALGTSNDGDYLEIIDVSNKSNPILKGSLKLNGNVYKMCIEENYLVYIAGDTIGIIDTHMKWEPFKMSIFSNQEIISDIVVMNDTIYATDQFNFKILSIKDKSKPVVLSSIKTGEGKGSSHIEITGRYAYLCYSENGIYGVEISDPTNPVIKSRYEHLTPIYFKVRYGNYMYFSSGDTTIGTSNIYIFDITSNTPILSGMYNASFSSNIILPYHEWLYMTNGTNSPLFIFKIGDNLTSGITIVSPDGDDLYTMGVNNTVKIVWMQRGIDGDVMLDLFKGNTFCTKIATVSGVMGNYSWDIPSDIACSDGYRIRIEQNDTKSFSDRYFSIQNLNSKGVIPDSKALNFETIVDNIPTEQTLYIDSEGEEENEPLTWVASADHPWIELTPSSGTGSGVMSVKCNTMGMAKGIYHAIINFKTVNTCCKQGYTMVTLAISDNTTPPFLVVNRKSLTFSQVGEKHSYPQRVEISNSGSGIFEWTASTSEDWLMVTPSQGIGNGTLQVEISPSNMNEGTYKGKVKIMALGALNSPTEIDVTLKIVEKGEAPFGYFETPEEGAVVSGSVPVTGWALDDVNIESVKIYRNPVEGEGEEKIYIGDAIFVEGARKDVEEMYGDYPDCYRSGWGYVLLTNMLPNNGNGTFTLYAEAWDVEGNRVTLGSHTIICNNKGSSMPFGAIDTPSPGETTFGSQYMNSGWALTPPPGIIAQDAATINIWIDGKAIGHPRYNNYREDIAGYFPGYKNSKGAGGYFSINTTQFSNGIHSIHWTAIDNYGNIGGIGSRFFFIRNPWVNTSVNASESAENISNSSNFPINTIRPLKIKKGYNENEGLEWIYPNEKGILKIELKELERVEIGFKESTFPEKYRDEEKVKALSKLPVGSTMDEEEGNFYWIPGPGFIGNYELVFKYKGYIYIIAIAIKS